MNICYHLDADTAPFVLKVIKSLALVTRGCCQKIYCSKKRLRYFLIFSGHKLEDKDVGSQTDMHQRQCSFIHSFIQAISIAPPHVHYYPKALPTQYGYCVGVSRRRATDNCE